jgi:hypothetical protein
MAHAASRGALESLARCSAIESFAPSTNPGRFIPKRANCQYRNY